MLATVVAPAMTVEAVIVLWWLLSELMLWLLSNPVQHCISSSVHMCIVRTFILQIYLNTLLMYKVGECYFPNIVRRQYFSTI
jgi:hypothetical protein